MLLKLTMKAVAVAMEVARELVVYLKRPGGQSQFSALLRSQADDTAAFDELILWIAANLQRADLTVEFPAERAPMSPRDFARLCRQKTGRTPAKAVEVFRPEATRRLLEDSSKRLARRGLHETIAQAARSRSGAAGKRREPGVGRLR